MHNNPKTLYRFRSLARLLGNTETGQELLKQEIYFSPPEHLNDPMEGHRNIVWIGDQVLWRNLLSHFMHSIFQCFTDYLLIGEEKTIPSEKYLTYFSEKIKSNSPIFNDYLSFRTIFFNNSTIIKLINFLSSDNREINQQKLESILDILLPHILLNYQIFHYKNTQTLPEYSSIEEMETNAHYILNSLNPLLNMQFDHLIQEQLISARLMRIDLTLQKFISHNIDIKEFNKLNLSNKFPVFFIKALLDSVYPKWYVSCFMSSYNNSSVWGGYGDNHKGICLIYQFENNKIELNFEDKEYLLEARKVYYSADRKKINFFENLGCLTFHQVQNLWLTDQSFNTSSLKYKEDYDENWSKKYMESFLNDLLLKSKDWQHENEYRLLLTDALEIHTSTKKRKLKYKLSSLKGIIFGISTPEESKIEIFKIIQKIFQKNKDFKFYQAYYSNSSDQIEKYELRNLNNSL